MKDAAILVLLGAVVWMAFGTSERPQAEIQDTTLHPATLLRGPQAPMLFSPCPVEPRVFRKWQERRA